MTSQLGTNTPLKLHYLWKEWTKTHEEIGKTTLRVISHPEASDKVIKESIAQYTFATRQLLNAQPLIAHFFATKGFVSFKEQVLNWHP
jgi:hypothetical protein